MTYDETLTIMSVLKAAYPNYYKDMRRSDADAVVALWVEMFKDDPVEIVAVAVKAHIATDKKGFPPHIGAIKEAIVKLKTSDEMTELEAWGCVLKAIRNSNYNSAQEFDALPPVVRRLVGSPNQLREWAQMDSDTINSVVASNFQRSYKARAANEREFLALPSDVKETIEALAAGMKMPALQESNDTKPDTNIWRRQLERAMEP